MTSDFEILMHQNSDNLHLKLAGSFDAPAAQQLCSFIKAYGGGAGRIFIHTSDIKQIDYVAPSIFRSSLYGLSKNFFTKLVFTGKEAATLAPKNSQIL